MNKVDAIIDISLSSLSEVIRFSKHDIPVFIGLTVPIRYVSN